MSAPAVRPPWPGRSSPAERRNLSVLSVLQSSSPRDVPAAPNPSLARGEPGEPGRGEGRRGKKYFLLSGLYHSRVGTGTPLVSSVRCVNSPWPGRDLLLTARTSSVQSARRTNSWGPTSQQYFHVFLRLFLMMICDRNTILFIRK